MHAWTDVHSHLGDFPDPAAARASAARAGVRVIGSTVLASEYARLRVDHPETGLGIHPMHADAPDLEDELALYRAELPTARWISEIGLDGWMVGQGGPTMRAQRTLLAALFAPGVSHAILSLHSREAEEPTVDMVLEAGAAGAVYHWYAGSLETARRIVDAGHLFSVNPMMVANPERAEFLRWAPADALLLETDGPQLVDGTPSAHPADLPALGAALARLRGVDTETLRAQLAENLARLERS